MYDKPVEKVFRNRILYLIKIFCEKTFQAQILFYLALTQNTQLKDQEILTFPNLFILKPR